MSRTKRVLMTMLLTVLVAAVSLFGFNVISAGALSDAPIVPYQSPLKLSVNSPSSGTLSVSVANGAAGYRYQYWIKTKVVTDSSSALDQYIWQMYGEGFGEQASVSIPVGDNEVVGDAYYVIVRVKDGTTIVDELYGVYSLTEVGQPAISSIEVSGQEYTGEAIILDRSGDYAEYYNNGTVYSFLMDECTADGSNGTFKLGVESGNVEFKADGTFTATIIPTSLGQSFGGLANPTIINGEYYINNGVCYMSGDGQVMSYTIQKLADGRHKGSISMKQGSYNLVLVCQTQPLDITLGNLKVKGNMDSLTYKVYYGDSEEAIITSDEKGIDFDFSSYAPGLHKFRVEAINGENVATEYFTVYIYEDSAVNNYLIITGFEGETNKATGATQFTMLLKYPDGRSFSAGDENLFDYSLTSGSYKSNPASKVINGDTLTVIFNVTYGGYGIFQTTATVSKAGQSGICDKVIVYYAGYSRGKEISMSPAYGSSISVGQTMTITANGSIYATLDDGEEDLVPASDLRYAFYREDASGWVKIKDYGNNTLEWTPQRPGTYRIQARVKDVNAASYEKEISCVYTVTGTSFEGDISLDIFNYDGSAVSDIIAGRPYKLVVNYSGPEAKKDSLLYMFTLTTANLGTIYLNSYSPGNSIMFVPARSDTYTVTARVIDKGSFGYKDATDNIVVEPIYIPSDVYSIGVKEINLYTSEYGEMKDQYTIVDTLNGGAIPTTATVTFTSEDPDVVTVDSDGIIRSVGVGVTRVIATFVDGANELTDYCIVNVALTSVDLNKTIDIFLDAGDGDQVFSFADLGVEKQDYQWFEVTKEGNNALSPAISGNDITFSFTNADCGEKEVHLLIEGRIEYVFTMAVITKVIKTADELSELTTYGTVTDVETNIEKQETWHPTQNAWKQKGYFVLGEDIDLTGQTIANMHTVYGTYADYGLIGGFDGRGHTIIGGTYSQGGLFGNIPAGSVVKNVAIVGFTLRGSYSAAVAANITGKVENVLISCDEVGLGTICGGIGAYINGTIENCVVYWNSVSNDNENTGSTQVEIKGALAYCFNKDATATNCIVITDAPNPYGYSNGGTENNLAKLALSTKWSSVESSLPETFDLSVWSFVGDKPTFKTTDDFIEEQMRALPDLTVYAGIEYDFVLPYGTTYSVDSATPAVLEKISYQNGKLLVDFDVANDFTFTITLTYNQTSITEDILVNVIKPATVLNKTVDLFLDSNDGDMTIDVVNDLGLTVTVGNSTVYEAKFLGTETTIPCTATATGVTLGLTADMYGEKTILLTVGTQKYQFDVVVITKVITTAEQLAGFTELGTVTDFNTYTNTSQWWSGTDTYWKQYGCFVLGSDIDFSAYTVKYRYIMGLGDVGTPNIDLSVGGLNGVFDGRGYTISGGTYGWGGLFGSVAKGSVIKNVAIVNATLSGDYAGVLGTHMYGTLDNVLIECANTSGTNIWGGVAAVVEGTVQNSVIYWAVPENNTRNGAIAYRIEGTIANTIVITNGKTYGYTNMSDTSGISITTLGLSTVWSEQTLPEGFNAEYWDMTGTKPAFKEKA